jgi:uroporphyrinogen decarboxylase
MDPAGLKKKFGDRIVFWGAMDVQQFLPFAKPGEVAAHARELAAVLGYNGGYVMAPAHEMQDDIPPENIVAWVEAVKGMAGR